MNKYLLLNKYIQ